MEQSWKPRKSKRLQLCEIQNAHGSAYTGNWNQHLHVIEKEVLP